MTVTQLQLRRGTTAQCGAMTPAQGEVVYDTTLGQLRLGDGTTAGGKVVWGNGDNVSYGNGSFSGTLSVTGHITVEAVTSTGATGTGKIVFHNAPGLINPTVGTQAAGDNSTKAASTAYVASAVPNANKIINGDMRVDQRNLGNSALLGSATAYVIDRWAFQCTQASKVTAGQSYGAVTPPPGFSYYLGAKVTTTFSVGSTDAFDLQQRVEGLNIADLNWGTAAAQEITLSFWAYSDQTGTFGGAIQNSAANRSYPFTYSLPNADTWTLITVTIPGDTSGAWNTNSSEGLRVVLGMGIGSTLSGAVNTWAGSDYRSATGAKNLMGTLNALFYVTGMKLEAGGVATPYVSDHFQTLLDKCQRYFQRFDSALNANAQYGVGYIDNSTQAYIQIPFLSRMRAAPTFASAGSFILKFAPAGTASVTLGLSQATPAGVALLATGTGLSAAACALAASSSTSTDLAFDAEL